MAADHWLGQEIAVHKKVLRPGTIIDVGANYGDFSNAFLGQGLRVVAVEPNPNLAAQLGQRPGIHAIQAAMFNKTGKALLTIPGYLEAWGSLTPGFTWTRPTDVTQIEVDTLTLDSLDFPDVTGIKVDVEGAELEVLEGGKNLLLTQRPFVSAELAIRHRADCIDTVSAYMKNLGFDCYFYLDRIRPLSEFDLNTMQTCEPGVGGAVHMPYVHCFFFIPTENQELVARLLK